MIQSWWRVEDGVIIRTGLRYRREGQFQHLKQITRCRKYTNDLWSKKWAEIWLVSVIGPDRISGGNLEPVIAGLSLRLSEFGIPAPFISRDHMVGVVFNSPRTGRKHLPLADAIDRWFQFDLDRDKTMTSKTHLAATAKPQKKSRCPEHHWKQIKAQRKISPLHWINLVSMLF